jgi:Nitrile hydratase, alpha chain
MKPGITSFEALLGQISSDEDFKNRFMTDPKSVLTEMGVILPDSVEVVAHENTSCVKNYILPLKSNFQRENFPQLDPSFEAIIKRAWDDEDFKSHLLHNPKAAIKEVTQKDVPEDLEIYIYEQTPNLKHLVFQTDFNFKNIGNTELSEEELEMVSGGSVITCGGYPLIF